MANSEKSKTKITIEQKVKQRKEKFENKLRDKKQKIQNAIKSRKQEKELLPPMFDMLVIIVNRGRGQSVLNYLKTENIKVNIVSFGEGTAPSNVASLFGFNQEKEVIFTVLNHKDSKKVLDLLDTIFISTEKNSGIAFTIPLKSATNNSLDMLMDMNNLNNGGRK